MGKEFMAKQLARLCYKPKRDSNDVDFAAQLFIEKLVIPEEVDNYSEKQIEDYIYAFLIEHNI